jgi:hypothetical protein
LRTELQCADVLWIELDGILRRRNRLDLLTTKVAHPPDVDPQLAIFGTHLQRLIIGLSGCAQIAIKPFEQPKHPPAIDLFALGELAGSEPFAGFAPVTLLDQRLTHSRRHYFTRDTLIEQTAQFGFGGDPITACKRC